LGGFIDDTDIGVPTINFRNPEVILLIFIQTTESFGDVVQSKRGTHILGDEPDFTTALTLEDSPKLGTPFAIRVRMSRMT
jgi:hypothetical protein